MEKGHSALATRIVAGLFLGACAVARGADDFNEARLQEGRIAYQQKNFIEAINQFRIAAFGSLDKPAVRSESLARLSLAQAAAGKTAEADETLDRFLEVERRFGAWTKENLAPDIRADFHALLLRRVPAASLLAAPSLSGLVETDEQKMAQLPAAERRKALEAEAKREPGSVRWPLALARDAMNRGDAKEAERWAGKALALEGTNPDALALRVRARVARGDCAEAQADLSGLPPGELEKRPELYAEKLICLVESKDWAAAEQIAQLVPASLTGRSDVARAQQRLAAERPRPSAEVISGGSVPASRSSSPADPAPAPPATASPKRSGDAVAADVAARSRETLAESRRLVLAGKAEDAERSLSEVLKADPDNRPLRLALLEAACLARSYAKGAAQLPLVAPFSDSEAPSMFYAAMALYETGHGVEARSYLERALPRISGPLVSEYSRKILGRP